MRRLISATALALLALASSLVNSHAARRAFDCPVIGVSCPDRAKSGDTVIFTANVSNFNSDSKPTYNWTVSAGTIVSGRGTNTITVDTIGLDNTTIEATVEVAGLPDSCPRTASCAVDTFIIKDFFPIDEYGNLRLSDERARLDNFAIELQNEPNVRGYIIFYSGRRSFVGEAQRRAERARRYLVGVRKIAPERIVTIDGGYREYLTIVLWLFPKDATPPTPSPTVDPSEVHIIKGKPKGRARRH